MSQKILIAGASGFIGHALVQALLENESLQIIGLSRKDRLSHHPRLEWRRCDLFSLKDIKAAMKGCDSAYYLVHSMLPSASLSQGEFYDFDLILADNFRRAAQESGLQRLIYLGGLVPTDSSALSWHLRSRLEVEATLKKCNARYVMLRAGLIVGRDGSSFTILKRLVGRLPIMILPSWTQTQMEPIALPDVIRILVRSLWDPSVLDQVFDIGGREKLTYQDLILRSAAILGRKPITWSLNLIPLALSRFWVSLITQTPRSLVYPLVMSLKHTMLVYPPRAWPYPEDIRTTLDSALKEALVEIPDPSRKTQSLPAHQRQKNVRSVQRLPLPRDKDAEWASNEYFSWIPQYFKPFLQVHQEGQRLTFRFLSLTFLILEKSDELSTPDRQLLYIRGGLLARLHREQTGKTSLRGRLEFREVLDDQTLMAAIHDYYPSLPWPLYRYTQARVHLWVMRAFGRHLAR